MIVLVTFGLFFLLSFVVFSFATYHFQVKEYRFDRLFSAVKELGILPFVLPERFVFPKKSRRNFTMLGIVSVVWVCSFLALFLFPTRELLVSVLLPFNTLVGVFVAVAITGRISNTKRQEVIDEAIALRNKSEAVFIGITGSFAKSSVKEFLHQILAVKYKTGKTLGNYNTPIGVAMSLHDQLKGDTEFFVTEMGAYKRGEIKEIADFIKPSHAIITGLSNQHLSLFGSEENLVKAKSELVAAVPSEGVVYLNADSPNHSVVLAKYGSQKNIKLYSGERQDVEVYLKEFNSENGSSRAIIVYGNEEFEIRSKLKGRHNFVNLLPVVALATDLGVSKKEIIAAVNSLENNYGKLSLHDGSNGELYLYDGYSSNVEGFLSALDVLKTFDGEKLVITKGIIELDGDKTPSYKEILEKLSEIDGKMLTSDRLFAKLDKEDRVGFVRSESLLSDHIKKSLGEGIVVLVEGRFSDKFINQLGIKA